MPEAVPPVQLLVQECLVAASDSIRLHDRYSYPVCTPDGTGSFLVLVPISGSSPAAKWGFRGEACFRVRQAFYC